MAELYHNLSKFPNCFVYFIGKPPGSLSGILPVSGGGITLKPQEKQDKHN